MGNIGNPLDFTEETGSDAFRHGSCLHGARADLKLDNECNLCICDRFYGGRMESAIKVNLAFY